MFLSDLILSHLPYRVTRNVHPRRNCTLGLTMTVLTTLILLCRAERRRLGASLRGV